VILSLIILFRIILISLNQKVLAETDILHHTEEDIGKYNIFPLKDF
jgi:hypothetical protein